MTHLSTQSLGNWHRREHNGVIVMRMADLDPRQAAVAAVCATLRRSRPVRLCAIAACGFALAGCETLVPMPDAALLKPQSSPKCEARPEKTAGDGSSEAATLRRLDYEAQCYRHAEMIARARLSKLQRSIEQAKVKASKRDTTANP
jgi:hypothetical protein